MPVHATSGLNPQQHEAVTTLDGPLLIIAGAGSGKTRVITMRIAAMLEAGIPQRSILALTFTNKAAREMADRVRGLAGRKLRDLTVSTFHSFGVSILKRHAHLLGYRENFSIYDTQDQITLLRESAREIKMELEPGETVKILQQFSAAKTGRARWEDVPAAYRELYADYSEHMKLYNAVDFDDLILLPVRILSEHADVLSDYHDRFHYVMVDEFQDTSADQYRFLKLIAEGHRNVAVVGDDDQSIYSWRGANYDNFILFERDFPGYREIKLEQNYRSTDTILAAANEVIANNLNRKSKALWTGTKSGNPIELSFPEDESSEGIFIAETIKTLAMREQLRYGDVGVLVRTNSLTRNLEVAFLSENIPYRVSGGQSFFQRKEIKDVISYIRLLANPDDDVSLLRVLNTPRRGIGRKTLQGLIATAQARGGSLFSAISAQIHAADSTLGKRAIADLHAFHQLVEEYRSRLFAPRKMADTVRKLIDEIDYWAHLVAEHPNNDKAAKWKNRNVGLFLEFMEKYEHDPDNLSPSPFEFLSRITLDPRDDVDDENDPGKVNLMTIHAAKGLEHEVVFVAGCESGLIPHARALEEDPNNLEEERRLFYVALTRAKQRLFITSCRRRKTMREIRECVPSPFLQEIPDGLVEVRDTPETAGEEEVLDYFAALKAKLGTD
ncbi:MAG: ATP-dependent helicase [Spirochaetota bacterium]